MYVPQRGTDLAEMHFIINGVDQGICGKDIPYKEKPIHAVVDVYGTTKQVRIVQLYAGIMKILILNYYHSNYFLCINLLYFNFSFYVTKCLS